MKPEPIETLLALSEGKVVLVTGASSGLGQATARCYADAGFFVHTLQRSPAASADGLVHHSCDVSSPGELLKVIDSVQNASGRLDAVVHCAGVYLDDSITFKDFPGALRHSINTNLYGTLNILSACLPVMLNQAYGQFIYIGSSWASTTEPSRGGAAYKASKAAAQSLIATLSATYRDTGVDIQTFFPPQMATKITHFKGACPEGVAIDVLHLTLQFIANRRVV